MSLSYQSIDKLNAMGLKPLSKAFEEQLNNPSVREYSFEQRFDLMVDALKVARDQSKQDRLLKQAKLKQQACPENVKYSAQRGITREVMEYLFACDYIRRNQNIIITGATGTGKSYLGCALGLAAIRQKYSVFSIRLSRLFEEFQIAQGDGTIQKYRTKLARFDVLIIDDWALAPISTSSCHELLELIDDRMENGSIIITSQLPISKWHDYLGELTFADAILDRIVQRAHRIELQGESLRKIDLNLSEQKEE